MADRYSEYGQERIKHLEMVQAVVARLASNSFLVKGWALTVAGAFFGFAINLHRCDLAVVAAVTTGFFWALDTYFLRAERHFRTLYDCVRDHTGGIDPFFMAATAPAFRAKLSKSKLTSLSYWDVATSWTLLVFYGGLLVAAGVVGVIAD